ncbi:hypothetical protein [Haloferax sp. DFSO52]|uniref:hypothetical protein n=1 Tax=Haloferax sp. DFSO52 TaxID=3388505 RepID=UPI003A8899B2
MKRGTAAQWKTWMVVAVGVFVALYSVGTLAVMPWRYTALGTVGAPIQILGGVAAVGVGVALAWLSVTSARKT